MQTFSESAAYVLQFINQTNRSVFLTGKAGTGKTTLLKEILRTTHKNTVVVAPTGIAALNAGGVTIHSMFQLPFAAFIPDKDMIATIHGQVRFESRDTLKRHFRVSGLKQSVIRNMELLIIDEVSMLRADLLDAMEFMLQSVRKNVAPFGGVQMLFIGDLLQLPPVIKNDEWAVLRKYYQGKFFFHSHAVQNFPPLYIELSKIFRQTDNKFISILNNLRNNTITDLDLKALNKFVKPNFDLKENIGYVTLTTHNAKADAINASALDDLAGHTFTFNPEVTGEFPDKIFPVEQHLNLKEGAQIMFIKNDPSAEKNYFNGKTGIVKAMSAQEIYVHFPEENRTIEVEKYEWKNIRYYLDENSKEIQEEVLGTFVHYPIKLAWAITIHKSQGLTFEKAVLDVSEVFLPGQAYVALSRLRSLKGLVLKSPLRMNGISNDNDVMSYAQNKAEAAVLDVELQSETRRFVHQYFRSCFDWKDLVQEWRNHQFSYDEDFGKSEKSKHQKWAATQSHAVGALLEPSAKFMSQIDRICTMSNDNALHLCERVNAAVDYFFPMMDKLLATLLWKMEEVKRIKKVKGYFEELQNLDELQTNAVLKILKAQKLAETLSSELPICKESLTSPEIKGYNSSKLQQIKTEFAETNSLLIDSSEDPERYPIKSKTKAKIPKKATIEETLELWKLQNTISEIATIRKLTKQTISSHFAKLIQAQSISISDVMGQDKISELAEAFSGYTEETINGLKEKHGDRFTWDELKMFKASLT